VNWRHFVFELEIDLLLMVTC